MIENIEFHDDSRDKVAADHSEISIVSTAQGGWNVKVYLNDEGKELSFHFRSFPSFRTIADAVYCWRLGGHIECEES